MFACRNLFRIFDVFFGCDTFKPTMTPFINRKLGPKWFQREFPTKYSKVLKDNIEVWRNYLTSTLLPVRITNSKTDYKVICYYPHLAARRFGLSKLRPTSIATFLQTIYDDFDKMSEAQYHQRLRFFAGRTPSFVPVSFQASNECTESFSLWRKKYYLSNLVDEPAFRTNLITAFPSCRASRRKIKVCTSKRFKISINFLKLCIIH